MGKRRMKSILKDVIELSIFGGIIGVLAVAVKPFVSLKKSFKDVVCTVLISIISGLMLQYFDLPVAVQFGISGLFCSFAPLLHEGLYKIALRFSKEPEKFIGKIKK